MASVAVTDAACAGAVGVLTTAVPATPSSRRPSRRGSLQVAGVTEAEDWQVPFKRKSSRDLLRARSHGDRLDVRLRRDLAARLFESVGERKRGDHRRIPMTTPIVESAGEVD